MLLIHGDADKTVPVKNSELMETALREADVPVKLLHIVGEGHGGSPDRVHPIDYMGEMVRWFNQYLQMP